MPVLAFLAVAGSALIALLFLADATLEKDASPVIVTSQRPEAGAARAEASPQDARFTQPMNYRSPMNYQYRRSQVLDKFSIKGQ